jgi:DNA-binding CsgD family transcriptional regulator
MQRYSNLDTLSKTFQILRTAGLINPDGKPVRRSDRSSEQIAQPFKLSQRLAPSAVNELIKQYESGKSSHELAKTYGINKGSVIRLLRQADVSIRRQRLTANQVAEAAQLYASGDSLARIGVHLGVDHGTVWRALKKHGVPMRDTHGREC